MRISYGVSIVYHDCYLYAESILALDCDSYPYKNLINIPKRQRRLSTPSRAKMAGRSNKRFRFLLVRKPAKWHFSCLICTFLDFTTKTFRHPRV